MGRREREGRGEREKPDCTYREEKTPRKNTEMYTKCSNFNLKLLSWDVLFE